jgi:hypothetical protein
MDGAHVHAGEAFICSEVLEREPLDPVLQLARGLLGKVNATMFSGLMPADFFDSRMLTIRREITWVLPDPAQAII